jgi:Arc/MetJ-type ribon-helix-helix transcriptional regulator
VKKTLPVKGYDSVNLPNGLYAKVKALVKSRSDLGYRSVTEFVAEAVRKRTEEIDKTTTQHTKTVSNEN